MNEPQVWTVLGLFSAMMLGGLGLLARSLTAEIRALDAKHEGRSDRLEAQVAGLGTRLDTRVDGLEQRLDARIDGLEQRLDAKIDHVVEVLTLRIDGVEHRLGAVEDDLKIVKGHLLRSTAA